MDAIAAGSPRLPHAAVIVAAATLLLGSAAGLVAQTVSGIVTEAQTGQPVEGAEIMLIDANEDVQARTMTAADGRFAAAVPHPGRWILRIERVGYGVLTSDPLEIKPAEWLLLEVTLDARAVPLEPIVVAARRSIYSPEVQRFYDRRDGAHRSGLGYFVVRAEIERLNPFRPTDLLRTAPGIRVVRGPAGRGQGLRMASGCIPAIFIDGMQINRMSRNDSLDDYVTVMDIEGVEVYRGPSSQLANLHDPSGCGLVLVWTRGGYHDPDSTFQWRTVLGALGILALFALIFN
jgi:hypothetical protein